MASGTEQREKQTRGAEKDTENTVQKSVQVSTLNHCSNMSHLQRQQAELQAEQKRLLQAQRNLYPGRPIHLVLKVVKNLILNILRFHRPSILITRVIL